MPCHTGLRSWAAVQTLRGSSQWVCASLTWEQCRMSRISSEGVIRIGGGPESFAKRNVAVVCGEEKAVRGRRPFCQVEVAQLGSLFSLGVAKAWGPPESEEGTAPGPAASTQADETPERYAHCLSHAKIVLGVFPTFHKTRILFVTFYLLRPRRFSDCLNFRTKRRPFLKPRNSS